MAPQKTELFSVKYRPSTFSDFYIPPTLLSLLDRFIITGGFNLFLTGESGSGKTALLDCIVETYYAGHPDRVSENVMCLTPLKEQGVNYYKTDVRMFCQTSPTVLGKRKLVVIDDIDSMNELNQKIFQTYIDKYPSVRFVVSCTNTQKVIEGLRSRLNACGLERPTDANILDMISRIKHAEQINMTRDAEEFVAMISNRNINTAVNYMSKFKLAGVDITTDLATEMCTNINFKLFEQYVALMRTDGGFQKAVELIYSVFEQGYSTMDIFDCFFTFVKLTDLMTEDEKYKIIQVLCRYIMFFHNLYEDEIELVFFTNKIARVLMGR